MTIFRRFLPPALLLTLPFCPASAAPVPASLVGEWLSGAQYPASVYTKDFGGASGDSRRVVLNKDGTYVLTEFESTSYPSSFGTTGYPITCQVMSVVVERGTFAASGNKITLKARGVDKELAYTPDRLNNGCRRQGLSLTSQAASSTTTMTWSIAKGELTLKTGQGSAKYVRRTPAPPPPSNVSAFLHGEWHNGAVSPTEYYNTATGKWAEASGTSQILRFGPNFTYERTGLTVVTTYGCTSKLLVTEKGKVRDSNNELTFTPTTSSATGYTCTPGKVSTAKNHIKPYGALWRVRVETNGQHTLELTLDGDKLLFNRPPGTLPETTRTPNSSPSWGASSSSSSNAGTSSAPATPTAPAKWTASGTWNAVITVNDKTYPVAFKLQDDSPRIIGYGDDPVKYANGNSETGTLEIGLEVEGRTMALKVQGRFEGNRYQGEVRWTNYEGDDLGRGSLSMTRR
ncbi:hypothetical protein [Deinococcus humi]|uniref:Uncharacterized protein n=1 Tax=Deinococcus humi TaxID=662880 RepID=A0A7W8JTS0_9DEIO|nr:hypothetical protein [Deinococcus humi]MBB5362800.1 hypothetical protein [Deinococcus humi]GGO26198.1 hypothetical protein GCM10008949_16780 [Deinococcus humi]